MVLHQICVFGIDLKFHNVFSLAEILKIFLSETTKPSELLISRNDHRVVLQRRRFLKIGQSETRIDCGGPVY
jgi:hypothetical protein